MAKTVTCVLCDRVVSEADQRAAYSMPNFDDVVICPTCLAGEHDGHGENAEKVRACLAGLGKTGAETDTGQTARV